MILYKTWNKVYLSPECDMKSMKVRFEVNYWSAQHRNVRIGVLLTNYLNEWINQIWKYFFGLSTNVFVHTSELIHNKSHLIRPTPELNILLPVHAYTRVTSH